MMRAQKIYRFARIAVFILAAAGSSAAQESHIGQRTGHADAGKQLYFRYCWGCHGFHGDGSGENAPYLNILPRNFVAATFKCRSTPTGTLPTDEDLSRAIERGLVNSNMPSWSALTDQQRADLVAFIKTFSPRWKSEKPGDPIQVPAEPAVNLEGIQHGKELFTKLECWKCHGTEGRGDGPAAASLTDNNNQPIRPYDFESGSRFKCGTTNQQRLVQNFHDGSGRHADALFRGRPQTERGLGPSPLPADFAGHSQEPRASSLAKLKRGRGNREGIASRRNAHGFRSQLAINT
jgi:mono/diheme cytochrome c family protein